MTLGLISAIPYTTQVICPPVCRRNRCPARSGFSTTSPTLLTCSKSFRPSWLIASSPADFSINVQHFRFGMVTVFVWNKMVTLFQHKARHRAVFEGGLPVSCDTLSCQHSQRHWLALAIVERARHYLVNVSPTTSHTVFVTRAALFYWTVADVFYFRVHKWKFACKTSSQKSILNKIFIKIYKEQIIKTFAQ